MLEGPEERSGQHEEACEAQQVNSYAAKIHPWDDALVGVLWVLIALRQIVNLGVLVFHAALLECVAEDQASEPDQSEQNGPGSSGKQNYLCGIGKHLNPPARHA